MRQVHAAQAVGRRVVTEQRALRRANPNRTNPNQLNPRGAPGQQRQNNLQQRPGGRELPNSQVVVDGPMEVLSRDGSFVGEHIYTRIPGVAAQINAFNFPVWGMLEKFAPAFIAGVPTIVKPATPTGYVAAVVVRAIVDSGILPEGSLQLISGSARNLLDHLDYRDLLAFTGSASTANSLKSHTNVVQGGVRFTSETDSLNAAILGPDAVPGTPEFDAFI